MPKGIGATKILYSSLKQVEDDVQQAFLPATAQIRQLVLDAAHSDGTLSERRANDASLRGTIGNTVIRLFVGGADGQSAYDPRDGVTPLSPYARLINRQAYKVSEGVVNAHSAYMNRVMPDDLKRDLYISSNYMRETTRHFRESYADDLARFFNRYPMFRANPLASYEALHTWVDPQGYRLSDRIWNAGVRTRQRMDRLLTAGIRSGAPATVLADQLQRFLLPRGASFSGTRSPYGFQWGDGSFDAMRLARTEITHAHGQASILAGQQNPYVEGMDWGLSARHPKVDVCDGLATLGMNGNRLRPPYPFNRLPSYPAHPQCLCFLLPAVTATPAQVTATLRQSLQEARELNIEPFITPLVAAQFLSWMLGFNRPDEN